MSYKKETSVLLWLKEINIKSPHVWNLFSFLLLKPFTSPLQKRIRARRKGKILVLTPPLSFSCIAGQLLLLCLCCASLLPTVLATELKTEKGRANQKQGFVVIAVPKEDDQHYHNQQQMLQSELEQEHDLQQQLTWNQFHNQNSGSQLASSGGGNYVSHHENNALINPDEYYEITGGGGDDEKIIINLLPNQKSQLHKRMQAEETMDMLSSAQVKPKRSNPSHRREKDKGWMSEYAVLALPVFLIPLISLIWIALLHSSTEHHHQYYPHTQHYERYYY